MTDILLKAKSWQIFILIFGIPMLIQIFFNPIIFSENNPMTMMKFMPVILLIVFSGFFGWFWSIATGLQRKVPQGIKMKIKRFKTFFIIPLIYIPLVFVFMGYALSDYSQTVQESSGIMTGIIVATIVPLHITSMFGIFYSLYFAAKTLKTVELQREVSFSEFVGEIFLLWFIPLGIWFIQPKVNKMIM